MLLIDDIQFIIGKGVSEEVECKSTVIHYQPILRRSLKYDLV